MGQIKHNTKLGCCSTFSVISIILPSFLAFKNFSTTLADCVLQIVTRHKWLICSHCLSSHQRELCMVKRMLNCTNHLPNSECVYCVQAFVVQENGQMKILVGQHHVHIHTVNTYVTSYPLVVVSCTPVNTMYIYTLSTPMSRLTL